MIGKSAAELLPISIFEDSELMEVDVEVVPAEAELVAAAEGVIVEV